jgi:aldehyde dehydrogenase (NAD+)
MAPRRLLLVGMEPAQKEALVRQLLDAFGSIAPVPLGDATRRKLHDMLEEARAGGALVYGAGGDASGSNGTGPVLVDRGQPGMAIAQADIFAPVLTLIEVSTVEELLEAQAECPFGLTASLFGPEASCRDLAERLDVGSVFINDLIFPSADPRMPFGGRRLSGFGVTQGAEGLLEMTAIQTISVQRSKHPLHYAGATSEQAGILTGLIRAIYGRGLAPRVRSLLAMIRSARASR